MLEKWRTKSQTEGHPSHHTHASCTSIVHHHAHAFNKIPSPPGRCLQFSVTQDARRDCFTLYPAGYSNQSTRGKRLFFCIWLSVIQHDLWVISFPFHSFHFPPGLTAVSVILCCVFVCYFLSFSSSRYQSRSI